MDKHKIFCVAKNLKKIYLLHVFTKSGHQIDSCILNNTFSLVTKMQYP